MTVWVMIKNRLCLQWDDAIGRCHHADISADVCVFPAASLGAFFFLSFFSIVWNRGSNLFRLDSKLASQPIRVVSDVTSNVYIHQSSEIQYRWTNCRDIVFRLLIIMIQHKFDWAQEWPGRYTRHSSCTGSSTIATLLTVDIYSLFVIKLVEAERARAEYVWAAAQRLNEMRKVIATCCSCEWTHWCYSEKLFILLEWSVGSTNGKLIEQFQDPYTRRCHVLVFQSSFTIDFWRRKFDKMAWITAETPSGACSTFTFQCQWNNTHILTLSIWYITILREEIFWREFQVGRNSGTEEKIVPNAASTY